MDVYEKITLIFVFVVAILFFLSILLNGIRLSNNYDWPFMEELAFFNQYAICLFILPLYWFHQYKIAEGEGNDSLSARLKLWMFILGFLCSEALANAIFFKLMHMPGGNQLFMITAVLGILYVPFYIFRQYRSAS